MNLGMDFEAIKLPGYKVGRVDQAETALGAEMRLAKDKDANKKAKGGKEDKIVRRSVFPCSTLCCS